MLQSEESRLNTLSDAIRELYKIDGYLAAHATTMEEFEMASKQDRLKTLKGNL